MRTAEVQKNLRQLLGDIKSKEGLAIVILVALFYGWFPDSIKDLLGELLPNEWVSLILLVLSILILLILYWLLKRLISKIAGVKYEVETYDQQELKKVKVLMMGLSIPRLDPKQGHNWSQQEFLIKKCLEQGAKLKKVVVIPSPESVKYSKEFVEYMRTNAEIEHHIFEFSEAVDYEDMLGLQRTFNKAIESLKAQGYKEKEILIDITAGTKTFSVVASSLTFDNDIRMCYVNNKKQVVIFDMVVVKED
ncbi:hypothetical protein [Pampinifervens florentissimum]|uniref:hypothetical protein n=1 Tax=Pampinifervens florentissimum TaxID=1632019 RepID=UPI0013B48215|nr:hypothetical protein [Hydrogenobacter sp. T-8]QID32730.1 hypothetical protein G3M65_02630 [Hydrogenobacter sp. T-8]